MSNCSTSGVKSDDMAEHVLRKWFKLMLNKDKIIASPVQVCQNTDVSSFARRAFFHKYHKHVRSLGLQVGSHRTRVLDELFITCRHPYDARIRLA